MRRRSPRRAWLYGAGVVLATDVLTLIGYALPVVLAGGIGAILLLRHRDRRRSGPGDE